MTLATTSRTNLRYAVESVFGTIPSTPAPETLRMTGESLTYAITSAASAEMRGDRQTLDLIQTGASASGGVNFELSYREYDDFLEAALQGTWSVYGTAGVGTTFSATMTATTITAAVAPTGSSAFTTLVAGQWFQLNAPTGANNDKFFKVSSVTPPTTTVITLDASTPASVEGPITNSTISASRLKNGTTQRSFSMEKEFADVAQFFAYVGMVTSKMTLNFASGSIVTGAFDFLGKSSTRANATQLIGTPTVSTAYDVMNATAGVGNVLENGAPLANTFIKTASLTLDNKLRGQTAVGVLGNAGIGSGSVDIGGSIEIYLASGNMYDKFVGNTPSSLSLRVTDAAQNGYIFTFGKIKYSDAKVTAGARDQDAMITMPWSALMDSTGVMMTVDRVGL